MKLLTNLTCDVVEDIYSGKTRELEFRACDEKNVCVILNVHITHYDKHHDLIVGTASVNKRGVRVVTLRRIPLKDLGDRVQEIHCTLGPLIDEDDLW